MGISIIEFRTAMEVYGATRLPDYVCTKDNFCTPCFEVKGVSFMHSGSYYIVPRESRVPDEIMDKAMAEFGEKHHGGSNYWWGEIHSVKGILTIAAMLDGKYDKEKVNEMARETYKRIFEHQNNFKFPNPHQDPWAEI